MFIVSAVLFTAALGLFASELADRGVLARVAEVVTADRSDPEKKALALLHWVHALRGTKENSRYFLIPSRRATALQVLQDGGDCADKSRLLVALLNEVGIRATPVLCRDRRTNHPTHTVVLALAPSGAELLLDPAFDMWFPRPDGAAYHGLSELRRDPDILRQRVAALRADRPRRSPIQSYDCDANSYLNAASFNWEKNDLARSAYIAFHSVFGDTVHRWLRPSVLENPKLCVAWIILGLAAACLAAPHAKFVLKTRGRAPSGSWASARRDPWTPTPSFRPAIES